MNRLVVMSFLPLLIAGCVVVTSYTYKPISAEGVVRSERCSAHYSYMKQIDEGITLHIDTADGNYNFMYVVIGIDVKAGQSLRFLENKIKLESGDDASVEYGEVHFFSSVVSIKGRPIQKRETALLTGRGSGDDDNQIVSALGYMPYVALVKFGKFFPKRFTLYLPRMQTSTRIVSVPPLSFEMQAEKSVSGVLCGL